MPQTFARNQVGVREDLADKIYLIDAKTTPFLSGVPKGAELVNTNFDWQADAYDTPNPVAVRDGQDGTTTEDAAANRERLYGRCQKLWKRPKTSTFTDINDVAGAGVGKEFARAIMKKTVELKREVETVLGSDQSSQDDNGTVAYQTRGLGEWIKATEQSHLPISTGITNGAQNCYRTPTASIDTTAMASLTPAIINTVMQSQYEQTGNVQSYAWIVGTLLKKQISTLTGYQATVASNDAILRTNMGDAGSYMRNVKVFEGDFGTYDVILSNYLGWSGSAFSKYRGYALDWNMLELRMNQPWKFTEEENKGGGKRGRIEVIFGLAVKNPLGLAKFAAAS